MILCENSSPARADPAITGHPCPRRNTEGVATPNRVRTLSVFIIFDPTLKITQSGWHGNLLRKNLLDALTPDGLLQSAVALDSRISLTDRLAAPVSKTTSAPATPCQAYHMFTRGGEPAAPGA